MGLELERGGNAEVAAAAAHRPEEVGVLFRAGPAHAAVRHDQLHRAQVVEGQAVLGHEPAQATAQREAGDASGAYHSSGRGQPMDLRLAVVFLPEDAALGSSELRSGIDMDALHRRQVDHEPVVDGGPTGHVVAATADGHFQIQRPSELYGVSDIGSAPAAGDESRALIDEPVVNAASLVIAGVPRLEEFAGESRSEVRNGCGKRHGGTSAWKTAVDAGYRQNDREPDPAAWSPRCDGWPESTRPELSRLKAELVLVASPIPTAFDPPTALAQTISFA